MGEKIGFKNLLRLMLPDCITLIPKKKKELTICEHTGVFQQLRKQRFRNAVPSGQTSIASYDFEYLFLCNMLHLTIHITMIEHDCVCICN